MRAEPEQHDLALAIRGLHQCGFGAQVTVGAISPPAHQEIFAAVLHDDIGYGLGRPGSFFFSPFAGIIAFKDLKGAAIVVKRGYFRLHPKSERVFGINFGPNKGARDKELLTGESFCNIAYRKPEQFNSQVAGGIEGDQGPPVAHIIGQPGGAFNLNTSREFLRHGSRGMAVKDTVGRLGRQNDGRIQRQVFVSNIDIVQGVKIKAMLFEHPAGPALVHIGHPAFIQAYLHFAEGFDLATRALVQAGERNAGFGCQVFQPGFQAVLRGHPKGAWGHDFPANIQIGILKDIHREPAAKQLIHYPVSCIFLAGKRESRFAFSAKLARGYGDQAFKFPG